MEQVPRGIPSEGGSVQAVMWGKETVRCLRCVLSKALMAVLQQMRRVRRGEGSNAVAAQVETPGADDGDAGECEEEDEEISWLDRARQGRWLWLT